MNKIKSKKTLATALLLSAVVATGCGALALGGTAKAYGADDYHQQLDGTKIFYTGIRGAEVTYSPEETVGGESKAYTMFSIEKDETVSYRQNLAYAWKTANTDENASTPYVEKRFSMEIGFSGVEFERYVIAFQSQQHVLTEDKITQNFVVFTPSETEEGKLNVSVVNELEDDTVLTSVATCDASAHIKIAFGEYTDGGYPILINGNDYGARFENVYESYATYVSSGDTAVTPLTFSAKFADDAEAGASANMILYDINGQTFELKTVLKDSDGNPKKDENGNTEYKMEVLDNASPVICFNSTPSYLIEGSAINFSYKVIDVLGTSTRATAYYYVLTGDQYGATDFDYDKTDYTKADAQENEGEGEGSGATEYENPFIEVTSSSNIRIIRDEKSFVPRSLLDDEVYGLVKIYYEISDRSGSTAKSDKVFVDWYAKEDALIDIYSSDLKDDATKSSNFIKLISEEEKKGLTYAQSDGLSAVDSTVAVGAPLESYKQSVEAFRDAYQRKIDEAISALEGGKLYAGSDSKFYLPSFDDLKDEQGNLIDFDFATLDGYLNSSDYKYSIYYKAKDSGSATSLSVNNISISLTDADVHYRFTIFITDSFGNPMLYPVKAEDGGIEWKEIATGDIWEKENAELLPFFEFYVGYKEATAEAPEKISLAYVDSSYSGISFKINGVSGTYTTSYNLYVFDRNKMNEELGIAIDYDTFLANIDKLINDDLTELDMFTDKTVKTSKYFTMVKPVASLLETDANYEMCKSLKWNANSVSFTPRSVEEFYVVELTLTDKASQISQELYTAVSASVKTTSLKGESDWLEKNLTSIILFSVAGVCLIALVLLLVIKPKDKGDIDSVYEETVNKKGKRKGKKQASADEQ
ncbi:MAG: hypothetical protein ACI4MS_01195 [Candidatus Coproplasma sp.]